jgi:hypothetical protein
MDLLLALAAGFAIASALAAFAVISAALSARG